MKTKKVEGKSLKAEHTRTGEYYKNTRGITLVALVITIIVLLILAGITLTLVMGENGLIAKAQQAGKNYTEAGIAEGKGLNQLENEMIASSRQDETTSKGLTKEVLWEGSQTTTGTITLNKSIEDFDMITAIGQYYGGSTDYNQTQSTNIFKEDYYSTPSASKVEGTFTISGSLGNEKRRIVFGFTNSNEITIGAAENMRLLKVYGINF